jgi:hypothetical protein
MWAWDEMEGGERESKKKPKPSFSVICRFLHCLQFLECRIVSSRFCKAAQGIRMKFKRSLKQNVTRTITTQEFLRSSVERGKCSCWCGDDITFARDTTQDHKLCNPVLVLHHDTLG